jgi:hypothetical protein
MLYVVGVEVMPEYHRKYNFGTATDCCIGILEAIVVGGWWSEGLEFTVMGILDGIQYVGDLQPCPCYCGEKSLRMLKVLLKNANPYLISSIHHIRRGRRACSPNSELWL